MRNIFVQPEGDELKNIKGVYIEDKESFEKDEPDIIKKLSVQTTAGNPDPTWLEWKAYLVDLGGGDIGLCIVDGSNQS
jgi:hypothetical protein